MAFNVNHGLIMRGFETVLPNGDVFYAPLVPTPGKTGAAAVESIDLAPKRTSSLRSFTASDGTRYDYVVVNDEYVSIESCQSVSAVLEFPERIEDLAVLALGPEVCAENEQVERIIVPDSVRRIGACAFRLCPNLRFIRFPALLQDYSASWVQHCNALEAMVLPGQLEVLSRAVFDHPSLRALGLGAAVREVEPGACEKADLAELSIDPANPHLITDGAAIYSSDGKELKALVRPVETYEVLDGCTVIGKKAAKGRQSLCAVRLPSTLERIFPYAFAHSGLEAVELPKGLESIGERAFFHCSELREVILNEGLIRIDDAAFAESSLEGLIIPASLEHLGTSVTLKTAVTYEGPQATYGISEASPHLFYDGHGGVYRRGEDGIHFIQLVDSQRKAYEVFAGTKVIDAYSFAFHDFIESVVLPEGVERIEPSAFRVCRRLKSVELPESLVFIGKEAFIDTVLESLRIPTSLETVDEDALVTAGAHHSGEPFSLHHLEVSPENEHFYCESGILCKRGEYGDRALLFDDATPVVRIPDGVSSIAPYAFNNARSIRQIFIGPNLKTIAVCGLTTWSMIERIDITLPEPEEGRTHFVIEFPATDKALHEISISLGGSSWVNVPEIYRHYDNCLASAHDYHNNEGVSPYEQATRILKRLDDPIFLTPVNRSMAERVMRLNLLEICVDIARHDDRRAFLGLVDHGFLDAANIEEVIMAIRPLQDAAMTGYLLELKRERFSQRTYDFEL